MFCNKCGAKIPDESAFCMKCGAKLPVMGEEPAPAPEQSGPAPTPEPAVSWEFWEPAVVVPIKIAESKDGDMVGEWLRTYNKEDGVFTAEHGTKIIRLGWNKCAKDVIKTFYIPDSVVSIGNYAFLGCKYMTSISIPDSVTKIYEGAFGCCTALKDVNIPGYVEKIHKYAFRECTSLTSITIPDSVTEIGEGAFYDCSSLTSITIPDSVTTICDGAFGRCTALKDVNIPDPVTVIGKIAFYGCSSLTSITIPRFVTTICESAFGRCTALKDVNIPDPVTVIGKKAFYGCSSLTSIIIPDSVTEIGDGAFGRCTALKDVNIPGSVEKIHKNAFRDCKSLTSITIPDSVTEIGEEAFRDCRSLKSVSMSGNTKFDKNIFKDCPSLTEVLIDGVKADIRPEVSAPKQTAVAVPRDIAESADKDKVQEWFKTHNKNGMFEAEQGTTVLRLGKPSYFDDDEEKKLDEYTVDLKIKTFNIPGSVTEIGNHAFYGCSSLKSINIPDSVKTIGTFAFRGCSSLTSITIPDSVPTIGDAAFHSCSSLKSINIPDSVMTIGEFAFFGCSSLTSITIPNSVTRIGNDAFMNCSSLTSINIPDSVTAIGVAVFYGCSSLKSINIPDSVTAIDELTFYDCTSLTSINIPNSVTRIGDNTFMGCSSLTSINIPDSVTAIGGGAFLGCSSLTSITIPDSVTKIGELVFRRTRLNVLYMSGNVYVDFPKLFKSKYDEVAEVYIPRKIIIDGKEVSASEIEECLSPEQIKRYKELGFNVDKITIGKALKYREALPQVSALLNEKNRLVPKELNFNGTAKTVGFMPIGRYEAIRQEPDKAEIWENRNKIIAKFTIGEKIGDKYSERKYDIFNADIKRVNIDAIGYLETQNRFYAVYSLDIENRELLGETGDAAEDYARATTIYRQIRVSVCDSKGGKGDIKIVKTLRKSYYCYDPLHQWDADETYLTDGDIEVFAYKEYVVVKGGNSWTIHNVETEKGESYKGVPFEQLSALIK